jgi:hypothetical protein
LMRAAAARQQKSRYFAKFTSFSAGHLGESLSQ